MASVRTRENTFKVLLSTFPKRPTFEELHIFVYQTLGLRLDQVVRLQMNHAQNCVHVKCIDLKTAQDTVINHDGQHELEVNKKKYKVRLQMDDGGVEIKIHDLSENVTKEEIVAALRQYGDVLSTKELCWSENFVGKGTASGVWVVKMDLRRHIKSFITIQGEQTLVTYRNQPQTCRHCMNLSHPGSTCVENKKLLGQRVDLENRLNSARASKGQGSTPVSFAAVLNNEAPLTNTSPFVRIFSTNEAQTMDSSLQRQQTFISGTQASLSTPAGSSAIVPTTSPPSIVEVGEHDVETDAKGIGKDSTNEDPIDQSTQLLQKNEIATTSSGDVSIFKAPAIVLKPRPDLSPAPSPSLKALTMEISESESNDSASENNPFHTVTRGRRRSKKPRPSSPHSQTNPDTKP